MSRVRFINEMGTIMDYCAMKRLTPRERILWLALFYAANSRATILDDGSRDWPDDFMSISNQELMLFTGLDKKALTAVREALMERGIVQYIAGDRRRCLPQYRLSYISIGGKSVPNIGSKTTPNAVMDWGQKGFQIAPKDVVIGGKKESKSDPKPALLGANRDPYIRDNKNIDRERDSIQGLINLDRDDDWEGLI